MSIDQFFSHCLGVGGRMVKVLMPGLGNNVPPLAGTNSLSVKGVRMYSACSDLGLFKLRANVIKTRPLAKHRIEKQQTNGFYQASSLAMFSGTGMKISKFRGRVKVLCR